jgi:amino acid transporter
MDRLFWWDGSRWQPQSAPHVSGLTPSIGPPAQRAPRPPGYWRDFWLGFAGVILANIVLVQILGAVSSANLGGAATPIVVAAPWVLNLVAVVAFAIVRPRVALGMLLAYGIAFGCALLAGIVLAVVCFGGRGVP